MIASLVPLPPRSSSAQARQWPRFKSDPLSDATPLTRSAMSDPATDGAVFARPIHGPILVGTFLNIMLYGISVTQVYIYYSAYKHDRQWMKVFITVLFLADTVNSVFDMVFIYQSLINHFGDVNYIQNADWVFAADPAMTGIIGSMVQLFFAWRVRVLTGSRFATGVIAATAILECLGGIATAVAIGYVPQFLRFTVFQPAVIVWLMSSAVCDVLITSILVFHLRRHKSGFSHTDDIVDRVIRLTIQTGLLTSIVAIIDVVLYLGVTKAALHLAFNMPLCKLYTNSLLSSLNARSGWAFNTNSDPVHSIGQNGAKRRPDVVALSTGSVRPEVFVNVEQHEMVDVPGNGDKRERSPEESVSYPEDTKIVQAV